MYRMEDFAAAHGTPRWQSARRKLAIIGDVLSRGKTPAEKGASSLCKNHPDSILSRPEDLRRVLALAADIERAELARMEGR